MHGRGPTGRRKGGRRTGAAEGRVKRKHLPSNGTLFYGEEQPGVKGVALARQIGRP